MVCEKGSKRDPTGVARKEWKRGKWSQSWVYWSNIPKTVDEMMKKVDEFVRAEEAYASTELPPGESRDIHHRLSFPTGPRDVHQRLTFPTSTRNNKTIRSSQRRD
ncbi:hypothetical protein Tco_1419194 [Tanacetum coccineum]